MFYKLTPEQMNALWTVINFLTNEPALKRRLIDIVTDVMRGGVHNV